MENIIEENLKLLNFSDFVPNFNNVWIKHDKFIYQKIKDLHPEIEFKSIVNFLEKTFYKDSYKKSIKEYQAELKTYSLPHNITNDLFNYNLLYLFPNEKSLNSIANKIFSNTDLANDPIIYSVTEHAFNFRDQSIFPSIEDIKKSLFLKRNIQEISKKVA